MKVFFRKRYAAFLIFVLAAILAILGRLQYRSTQKTSEATAREMEASLQSSLFDFRHSLERELTSLCLELHSGGEAPSITTPREIARRFSVWRQTATHPAIANEVFVWDSGTETNPVMVSSNGLYKTSAWPASLADLPGQLNAISDAGRALQSDLSPPAAALKFGVNSQPGWMIDQQRLVLLHPTVVPGLEEPHIGWLVVPLNRAFFTQHLLPELVSSRFGSHSETYQVAVVLDGECPAVLYSSQPGFGSSPNSAADASLRLFGPPVLVRGTFLSHTPGVVFPAVVEPDSPHLFIEPIAQSPPSRNLTVIAQHKRGSLEAAIADLRNRNLLLNFGMLGILAVTLTLVVFTSQRAHTLAQMQMDFVAGVSHELRTPLTAIILAARNLEDGVVHENGLVRYGTAIKGQAAQLAELVDEILLFSETHSGRHVYKMEAVDVSLSIHTTLENLAPLIESSGFTVEENSVTDLGLVRADAAALTQCLQNLISNSIKYGGDEKWAGVRAFSTENAGKKEVGVSVMDRGLGIAPAELKQIFEPFYRSPEVVSQIHGNGLGLPLTKNMVEAMGGRLTVSSKPGKGSTFTIYLRPA